jgi:hypothetical protein
LIFSFHVVFSLWHYNEFLQNIVLGFLPPIASQDLVIKVC